MAKPLDGIRVVDLSRILAGPYCTQFLGEMGADVIKVEPPEHGDDTRTWGPPFLPGGEAVYFQAANRNKRGIALDLKSERGRDLVRYLVDEADVVVENFRPGTLEKWGLGYTSLKTRNPRLIHLSVTGFGQTGRYRERPGYDLIAQGMGGIMNLTGEADGPPTKVGLPVADLNGGTWSIIAVLMALHARERTGRGQYLDVSLLEAQLAWHTYAAGSYLQHGQEPTRSGNTHPMIVPYQAYPVADGWLNIAVGSQKLWRLFCTVLELDIVDDPRFRTNELRVQHREELNDLISDVLVRQSRDYWIAALGDAGVPVGPINGMAEIYEDPWAEQRDQLVRMEHPTEGVYRGTGFPVHASDTQPEPASAPPTLGQHTTEVLTDLGYDAADIERMRAENIVR